MSGTQLAAFGLVSVIAMITCYSLESRNRLFILGFAFSCWLASVYCFLQGAWPFFVAEGFWGAVAFRKWMRERKVPISRVMLPLAPRSLVPNHPGHCRCCCSGQIPRPSSAVK